MKTLFDEPVYKIGSIFYQKTGGDVTYRWKFERSERWSENCKCQPEIWKDYVLDRGVIYEDAV